MDEPVVLKSEVKLALAMMNRNKSAGPNSIVIEILSALDNLGIDKITEIINKKLMTATKILKNSGDVFIAMTNKSGAN